MMLVIFGLTISSSWGNGHATFWRALGGAMARRGDRILFFERDVPYYAAHRDFTGSPGIDLVLYSHWEEAWRRAQTALSDADVAMVTSYCPDAVAASDLVLSSPARLRVFYDLDTPVTLERIRAGERVVYIPSQGLGDFDLVLSYAGGAALTELQKRLGARQVAPLYGCVDPSAHRPVPPVEFYRADLSYLGTYAADRQEALEQLFIAPARRLPRRRFVLGGSQYPNDFPWTPNLFYVRHIPPPDHPVFYCSSRLTLNVTRRPMVESGYCPSGRLFEAAACGVPLLSDLWEGLDQFFEPGTEILIARSAEEAIAAIESPEECLSKIARSARERALSAHTGERRADDLHQALEGACRPSVQDVTL
ncbi:CgeB family protein [Candidatus Manganitrophus noduliformans]|uniref:Glycosyltransferase n=1 Tax=Candidatus Manganitrophus noduliformans TaxID=2606439 RepID=A0A7X6DMG6_9BACT|nr:glycosyltransferase [Candidatus Manganitrophus noduliformans]NKE69817.1 glycosyltransferase [Candidatus Manganitrophus noduliformans]